MKKLLAILISLIVCLPTFNLFGCFGGGNDASFIATHDDYNGSLKKEDADLSWTIELGGRGDQWFIDIKNKFQKATGKTVYLDAEKGISDKAGNQWETGTDISDVYTVSANPLKAIANGYIEPITDIYTYTDTTAIKDFDKLSLIDKLSNGYKLYGKVESGNLNDYYVLPLISSCAGIFYNKEIFKQVGWENRVPETYDELLQLCSDINSSNKGYVPFIFSQKQANYWSYLVQTWFAQIVGIDNYNEYQKFENKNFYNPEYTWTNSNGEQINFAQKKLEALNLLVGLIVDSNNNLINCNTIDITQEYIRVQADFATEDNAAMIVNGDWMEREVINSGVREESLEKIGFMPVPYAPNAKKDNTGEYIFVNNTLSTFTGTVIPSKAKHISLAKEFLLFLTKEENLKQISYDTMSMVCYNIDINKASFTNAGQEIYEVIKTANEKNGNIFFSPKSTLALQGKAGFELYNYYSYMLTGDRNKRKTPAECITEEWKNAQQIFG